MQKRADGHETESEPSIRFGSNLNGFDQLAPVHVNASPKLSSAAQKLEEAQATAAPTFGSDPPDGVEVLRMPAVLHCPELSE